MDLKMNHDSVQAITSIIYAIVEANVIESNGRICSTGLHSRLLSRLPNHKMQTGISISIIEENVYMKMRLCMQTGLNIITEIKKLQDRISEEIKHLTGLNTKKVDVIVEKLFIE